MIHILDRNNRSDGNGSTWNEKDNYYLEWGLARYTQHSRHFEIEPPSSSDRFHIPDTDPPILVTSSEPYTQNSSVPSSLDTRGKCNFDYFPAPNQTPTSMAPLQPKHNRVIEMMTTVLLTSCNHPLCKNTTALNSEDITPQRLITS